MTDKQLGMIVAMSALCVAMSMIMVGDNRTIKTLEQRLHDMETECAK